jgi:hypothetical protein
MNPFLFRFVTYSTNAKVQAKLGEEILKLKYGYLPFSIGYSYTDADGRTKVEQKLLFVPLITLGEIMIPGKRYCKQGTVILGNKERVSSYQIFDDKPEIFLDEADIAFAFCSLLLNPGINAQLIFCPIPGCR